MQPHRFLRIVLATVGSRRDVQPMLATAARLQASDAAGNIVRRAETMMTLLKK